MSSPRAAMSVASKIERGCDLKLIANSVYFLEFQVMSRYAPIEVFKTLALLKLGVKWEHGQPKQLKKRC
jgi:hypothetical protein